VRNTLRRPRAIAIALIVAGELAGIQAALARGGGGPPASTMTLNYCRQTVYNKGITDVARFEEEVRKCVADPVTYPPAYNKPAS
jgi:hypothetical protein